MNKKTLNEIKDRETARFNYRGEVTIKETKGTPSFSGSIDMLTTSKIQLGYNPEYEESSKPLEEIVEKPFEEAFTSVQRHELNHKGGGNFKGCPRNIDLHAENILEPVAETLQKLGYQNVPVTSNQSLYEYFANMFEDFIENSELGNKLDHTGMFLCYKDDASSLSDKKFTPLFEAFVKLQEKLYGGKRSNKLLNEHYKHDKKAQKAVDNFMQRSGANQYKEVTSRRKKEQKQIFDKKRASAYLLDENNWKDLATIFTEEFAKLVDKSKLQMPDYVKMMFMPLKGEGDSFTEEMNDPETLMKFAWKKYQKLDSDSKSFNPPAYLNKNKALDLVYQRLARNLEIKTKSSTKADTMPVMYYGKKPFEQGDRLSRARIGLKDGKLGLYSKRYQEDDAVEYTEKRSNIPNVRFIKRDDSGSMKESVDGSGTGIIMNPWAKESQQWGNNSRYHHTLVAEWSLYEFLKKQGTLKHCSVKSVSYSHITRSAKTLSEAKDQALNPTFGHDTLLDMEILSNMFSKDELVISISDGAITNWQDVKDEYVKRAKQNHYVHFQIGNFHKDCSGNVIDKPEMCIDLENAGIKVIYDNGKNLGKLVIDITRPYVVRK